MPALLLTRPEGRNDTLAGKARAAGFDVTIAPLLAIEPLPFTIPDQPFDALLLTSTGAVAAARRAPALPVYAVGPATARAATAAGLKVVAAGRSDGHAIVTAAYADGVRRLLHLRGAHGAELAPPAGLSITTVPVYRAVPATRLPEPAVELLSARRDVIAPLFSPRTARCFGALVDQAGATHPTIRRAAIAIVPISANAADAAGAGWRATRIAAHPTTADMLAAAIDLWQEAETLSGAATRGQDGA